ncbi:amidase [Phenylobacterium sp.]|uniref:amidase n=1 Tax=Phenylobacterium sp. TaxID=1871053 RepID=UPI0025E08AB0|nr:amidase [Phenylobacterium sp.]
MAQVTDDELYLPAHEQLARMRAGAFGPRALTEAYLARIEAINPTVRGVVATIADRTLAEADLAEAALRDGDPALLLGLPVGLKDIIDTAAMPTTYGSVAFQDHRPDRDAPVVRRLKEAGALVFAKTNTFEFALSMPSPLHRDAKNPWNRGRVAGGSSNGSATAVGAALCSLTLGTDTSGSIRNPSAYCGIVGLKTTHGRVSTEGVGVLASSMDTVGPMTRSVVDAALALQAIAGFEPSDMQSADVAVGDYLGQLHAGVAGLRIGVPINFFPDRTAPYAKAAWEYARDLLRASGAELVSVELPSLEDTRTVWSGLTAPESSAWHEASLTARPDDYGPVPRAFFSSMRGSSGVDYVRARQRRHSYRRALLDAMAGLDAMITPTMPTTAFSFDEAKAQSVDASVAALDVAFATVGFTQPFNVSGQPALTVPVAVHSDGLPLSVQVVGQPFGEAAILRIGRAIETLVGFDYRPPSFRAGAA